MDNTKEFVRKQKRKDLIAVIITSINMMLFIIVFVLCIIATIICQVLQ